MVWWLEVVVAKGRVAGVRAPQNVGIDRHPMTCSEGLDVF